MGLDKQTLKRDWGPESEQNLSLIHLKIGATGKLNDRQRLLLNKLLDGFEGKLTSSRRAKIAKCSQDTALRDIQQLIDQDVLVKQPPGGRSTGYVLMALP